MSSWAAAVAVMLAPAVACVGCAVGDDGEPYLGTTKRVGKAVDTFYVNNASEPEYLDPGKINDTQSGLLAYQLFEGLTKFDPRDAHLVSGVAASWERSDDNRILRFHLRPDARWSDGKPVTADDFVYAWRRVLEPKTASRAAASLYPLLNGELYNRGRLSVVGRDVDVTREPGAPEAVARISKGTAVRVFGRSPLVIVSDVAPLAAPPGADVRFVSRKKADAKAKKPEELSFGAKHPAASANPATSWKDKHVDVIAVDAHEVDCDGEPDRFYRVRLGDKTGWLPGCLMKAAPDAAFALVGRWDRRPTYRPEAPPEDVEVEPLGFIATTALERDPALLGVRAVDALTLEVELERPTPYFLELAARPNLYPVRRDVIEAFEKKGKPDLWTRPESMISNGPYMLDEWKFRNEITMKVNPYCRNKDRLKIKHIHWLEVEEYKATLSLYKTGEIDYIGDNLSIPPEYMPIAEKKKDFSRNNYLSVYWYELNTNKPPLDDVRVRKALDLAIDKKELVEKITRSGQTPAEHYVPDFLGSGYAEQVAKDRAAGTDPFTGLDHDFDPARARELLKEAGYEVSAEGTGFVVKGMPNVEILYNTSEGHKAIAVAIQNMWKQNLGISVTLRNEEWGVMQKDHRDGNFQVLRFGWVAEYNHPQAILQPFLSSDAGNQTGWASGEFDQAMRRAAREPDPTKSIELYREAEKIAVDGRSRIPLYFYTKSVLIKPWVKGFWGSPFNSHLVEWLWIDPDWERGAANEPAYPPDELPKPGRIAP